MGHHDHHEGAPGLRDLVREATHVRGVGLPHWCHRPGDFDLFSDAAGRCRRKLAIALAVGAGIKGASSFVELSRAAGALEVVNLGS